MIFRVTLKSIKTNKTVVVVLEATTAKEAEDVALGKTGKPNHYRVDDVRELDTDK